MGPLRVPQLKRKLALLIEHGHVRNQQALAAAIGRKPATIRWWINGSAARAPETISEDAVPAVLAVFAAALPDLDPTQIPSLLVGPAEDLELLFNAGAVPSLMRLVENDAQRDVGDLIPARRAKRDLIELSEPPERLSDAVIQRGHDFRIAFRTRGRGRFAVALQSAPAGWGLVPCSLSEDDGMIHLPGLMKGGLTYMKERVETGRHVFVAAQATQAFPGELTAALRDRSIFDAVLIRHFVRHFEALPKSSRWLFAMDVHVIDEPPA